MAYHRHVEMFIKRIDCVGIGRIGRRRQHVFDAAHFNNVRSVSSSSAFDMIGMDCATVDCLQCSLKESELV